MLLPNSERSTGVKMYVAAEHQCGKRTRLAFSRMVDVSQLSALCSPVIALFVQCAIADSAIINLTAASASISVGGGIMIHSFMINPNIPCDRRCRIIPITVLRILLGKTESSFTAVA